MVSRKELTDLLERVVDVLKPLGPATPGHAQILRDVRDMEQRLKDNEPEELNVVVHCHDEAQGRGGSKSLPMRVATEGYGVAVAALADENGATLGEVLMDFFDNKLSVEIYQPEKDDPVYTFPLQDNVKKARAAAKVRARRRDKKRPNK